jgi:transaldolase
MRDGRVSIEVDPRISVDPERTAAEARGLWWLIDRPNLFIKIPATQGALPAITSCIADGISVNVTLIFSIERYRAVLEAFMAGLELRAAAGDELSGIQSVASFFVSRVDTEVDRRLDELGSASEEVRGLHGQVAIANAGLAYEVYEETAGSDRWQALAAKGASLQRLLWASTGVKDKAFPPTRYVTELVANNTVNTMPAATLKATSKLGAVPANTIGDYNRCRDVTGKLGDLGIDLMDVAYILEQQAVASFVQSWTDLIASVEEKLKEAGAQVEPGGAIKLAGQATPARAAPNS